MFRSSEPFESQFRWEVDRWVFRFRQSGTPVEVSAAERERLIDRHIQRSKIMARAWFAGIFVAGIIASFGLQIEGAKPYVAGGYFGSALMLMFMLRYWADQGVTLHLRERRPIGEKLGVLGVWMMRAEVTSWPKLLLGAVAVMPAAFIAVTLPEYEFGPFERWLTIGIVTLAAGTVVLMIVVKLMLDWRGRRRVAWREALEDARELRVD